MNRKTTKAILAALAATTLFAPKAEAALDYNDFKDMIEAEKITVSYYDDTKINYSTDAATDDINTVDFSSGAGINRKLTGVITDADDGSSAVSVTYLNTVAAEAKAYSDANLAKANDYTDQRFNQSKAYTDDKFNQSKAYTDDKFKESKDYTDGIGAMNAAMSSIPAPIRGGKGQTSWGVGVGTFHGRTAAAAGISHDISDNVRMQIKAATYSGETMAGLGIGGTFGGAPTVRIPEPSYVPASAPTQIRTIKTSTNNYTNMYGHNFVVKNTDGVPTLYNLDGSRMTSDQLAKLSEDFAYNNGHEFDMSNFKKNPNGNWQYFDSETGQWLGGSEQSAVGEEIITVEDYRPMTSTEQAKLEHNTGEIASTPATTSSKTETAAPRKTDGSIDFDALEQQIREEAGK